MPLLRKSNGPLRRWHTGTCNWDGYLKTRKDKSGRGIISGRDLINGIDYYPRELVKLVLLT
jgi:hypothetical protein